MGGISQTGASGVNPQKPHRKVDGKIYYELNADIRLGLVLLAEHVYCIDGQKSGFPEIPGFRLLTQSECINLLGIDKSDLNTPTYKWKYPEQAKSQPNDLIQDVEFSMPSDLYKEFDNIYNIQSKNVNSNRPTNHKGEKIIFCGNKKVEDSDQRGNTIPIGGGILSNDGVISDCGFKAAIYERTANYVYHNVPNLVPPFDKNCLIQPKYILSFSGTDFSSGFADWFKTNLGQALPYTPLYPMQYKLAVNLGLLVARSIRLGISKKTDWLITGHSLGGGLSCAASVVSGINAVTFNSAGLNRMAVANYLCDLHYKANKGYISKFFDKAVGVVSLGLLTSNNERYIQIVDSNTSRNRVCAYRGTTDILTSTQDNIHGSKTNILEYIGLDEIISRTQSAANVGSPIHQHYDKAKKQASTVVKDSIKYAKDFTKLPTQLPTDIRQLGNSLKVLPGQIASGTTNVLKDTGKLLIEVGGLFSTSTTAKTKINNITNAAKQIGTDAQNLYKTAQVPLQQFSNISKIWEEPLKIYDETMNLWQTVRMTMSDAATIVSNPIKALTATDDNKNTTEKSLLEKLIQSAPTDGMVGSTVGSIGNIVEAQKSINKIAEINPKEMLSQGVALLSDVNDLLKNISNTFTNIDQIVDNPKSFIQNISKTTGAISKTIKDVKKAYSSVHDVYKELHSLYGTTLSLYTNTCNAISYATQLISSPQARFALIKNAANTAMKTFSVWQAIIPKPIAAGLSIVAHAAGEFPPRTYGKRIDINTEKYIEYENPDNPNYLAFTDDTMGHGLWILMDGFVYNIYGTNNHFITHQIKSNDGDASDYTVYQNSIARYWRWRSDDNDVKIYHKRVMAFINSKDEITSAYPDTLEIVKYCQPGDDITSIDGNHREKKKLSLSSRIIGSEIYIGREVDKQRYDIEHVPTKQYNQTTASRYLEGLIKTSKVSFKQEEKMTKKYTIR